MSTFFKVQCLIWYPILETGEFDVNSVYISVRLFIGLLLFTILYVIYCYICNKVDYSSAQMVFCLHSFLCDYSRCLWTKHHLTIEWWPAVLDKFASVSKCVHTHMYAHRSSFNTYIYVFPSNLCYIRIIKLVLID